MEFTEVIKNRYSCKKYAERQISDEQLTAILEAGRLAPTAKNLQEQHIYVARSTCTAQAQRMPPSSRRILRLQRTTQASTAAGSTALIRTDSRKI